MMKRLIGIEVKDHKGEVWLGSRYSPSPPLLYGKGCRAWYDDHLWIFYPIPLCYVVRAVTSFLRRVKGGDE